MLIRDGVDKPYMSESYTDTVVVTTDRGPVVIETTDTSLCTDDISFSTTDTTVGIETIIEYMRELATMHSVSLRCCDSEALIIVRDSYINTNVLTDLVGTSSDVSFSTAIASDADTIEVTISVTGDMLTELNTVKDNLEQFRDHNCVS